MWQQLNGEDARAAALGLIAGDAGLFDEFWARFFRNVSNGRRSDSQLEAAAFAASYVANPPAGDLYGTELDRRDVTYDAVWGHDEQTIIDYFCIAGSPHDRSNLDHLNLLHTRASEDFDAYLGARIIWIECPEIALFSHAGDVDLEPPEWAWRNASVDVTILQGGGSHG